MQEVVGLGKSVLKETSARHNHNSRLKVSFQNIFIFWCDLMVVFLAVAPSKLLISKMCTVFSEHLLFCFVNIII